MTGNKRMKKLKMQESCLTCEAGGFVNEGEPGEAFCYLDKGGYIKDAIKKARTCPYYRYDGSDTGDDVYAY